MTRTRKRNKRSKRSRRKLRGGWFPSFISDIGRSASFQFGNTFNELRGHYPGVNPSPLYQPGLKYV